MADDDKSTEGKEAAAAEAKAKEASEDKGKPADEGLAAKRAAEKKDTKPDDNKPGEQPTGKVDEDGRPIEAKPEDDKGKAPEPYYPEEIQDHLKGDTDKETIDKLHKAYAGARKELAQKKGAPEKAEDYTVGEDLADVVDIEDPIYGIIQKAAHEAGISKDAFGKMFEVLGAGLKEGDLLPEPFDREAEMKQLGKNGEAMVDAWITKLDGLKEQGSITDKHYVEGMIMGGTATAIELLNIMMEGYGEKPIPMGPVTLEQKLTEADLRKLTADPRYKTDKAYQAQVSKKFEDFYGTEPAGTSYRGIPGETGRLR